jgi:hypothetical protein
MATAKYVKATPVLSQQNRARSNNSAGSVPGYGPMATMPGMNGSRGKSGGGPWDAMMRGGGMMRSRGGMPPPMGR